MEIITKKGAKQKAQRWSRKGKCPSCDVSTGSKHGKDCKLKYIKLSINK